MSREKQIEEMAKDIDATIELRECEAWHCKGCQYEKYSENYMCDSIKQAEHLYNAGYRKQSEGEWIKVAAYNDGVLNTVKCSVCKTFQPVGCWDYHPYCPMCGAKMKGGAE